VLFEEVGPASVLRGRVWGRGEEEEEEEEEEEVEEAGGQGKAFLAGGWTFRGRDEEGGRVLEAGERLAVTRF
jgi:hypothetical protein